MLSRSFQSIRVATPVVFMTFSVFIATLNRLKPLWHKSRGKFIFFMTDHSTSHVRLPKILDTIRSQHPDIGP